MKFRKSAALIFIAAFLIVLSSCSSSKAPKDELLAAITKTMQANSYVMSMSMKLDELEVTPSTDQQIKEDVVGLLKDAIINVDAVYVKEPIRTDLNVELILPSLLNLKLDLPIILTEEHLYMKIPDIPLMPLSESLSGEYVVIELKELAEQQESAASLNLTASLGLTQEASLEMLKHFDEKKFFEMLESANASLPEGMKTDQVIQFVIHEGNYSDSVDIIVNEVIPGLLNLLLTNDAYFSVLQLDKAVIEERKSDWDSYKLDIMNILQDEMKLNELQLTNAIKDDYLIYQAGNMNVTRTDIAGGVAFKLGMSYNVQYSELNKSQKFEAEIPIDAVTLEQLKQVFQ